MLSFLSACGANYSELANYETAPNDGPIVCLGDSITFGFGTSREKAFPVVLEQLLGVPVINAGLSGDTTAGGLARLERDVLPHGASVVIVFLGGNDFLQKIPREEVFENINQILSRIVQAGSIPVLVHAKFGLFTDPYYDGYAEAAARNQALLVENVLKGILGTPRLMSDQIHPNAEGYQLIAERIAEAVRPLVKRD